MVAVALVEEDAVGLPNRLAVPALLSLRVARLDARASRADLAAADLSAASSACLASAAAFAAIASAASPSFLFSWWIGSLPVPCRLAGERATVQLPTFSLSTPMPFGSSHPNGDLLDAAAGEPRASTVDAAATSVAIFFSSDDLEGRSIAAAAAAAAALSFIADAAETVCTGDAPSGWLALAADLAAILRRVPTSGRARGGEETAYLAPPNRMGCCFFPVLVELDEEGVRMRGVASCVSKAGPESDGPSSPTAVRVRDAGTSKKALPGAILVVVANAVLRRGVTV